MSKLKNKVNKVASMTLDGMPRSDIVNHGTRLQGKSIMDVAKKAHAINTMDPYMSTDQWSPKIRPKVT